MEEVVVVGGGPAGLMAARTLAEEGVSSLVLERNREFGLKPCSEVMREERYGFPILPLVGKGVVEKEFEEMELVFYGRAFRVPVATLHPLRRLVREPSPLVLVNRERMERSLARRASSYGAKILLGKEVRKVEKGEGCLVLNGELRAKLVIGADGALSLLRSFIGERLQNLGYGINVRMRRKGEEGLKVFVDQEQIIPFGDAWRFAGGRKENVGIWTSEEKYARRVLERWEAFRKREALPQSKVLLTPLSSSPPCRTYHQRLLLAGDAGGLSDPLTGAGIYAALVTGYLAGKVAAEAVKKGKFGITFLRKYEEGWKRLMATEIRKSLLLKSLRPLWMRKVSREFLPWMGAEPLG